MSKKVQSSLVRWIKQDVPTNTVPQQQEPVVEKSKDSLPSRPSGSRRKGH